LRLALAVAGALLAGPVVAAAVPSVRARPATSSTTVEIPVDIRGRQVEYTGREGKAHFSGGVTVTRGTSTLMCDELDTIRGADEAIARGHVVFRDAERKLDLVCDEAHYTHGLARVNASGHCRLVAGAGDDTTVVTANEMEVLVETREALGHGEVRIVQGQDEALCADARLYGAENRVVLTGRPILRRPPHEFECDEMTAFFREGKSILTGSVRGRLVAEHLGELKKEGLGR